jgi:SPRY domain-containing SOCS box protein 1/4
MCACIIVLHIYIHRSYYLCYCVMICVHPYCYINLVLFTNCIKSFCYFTASTLPHPNVIPPKVRGLLSRPPVARQTQLDNVWDPAWFGRDIKFTNDGMTCRRGGIVYGSAAVRVRRPMTTGVHVWAVTWDKGATGDYTYIGVGTDNAKMNEYIGYEDESWGWRLNNNHLFHTERDVGRYPSNKDLDRYSVSDTFHLVLDMDEGTLSFVDGDAYLGVAFSGLGGRSLYVMAALRTRGQVSIKYHGGCPHM